MLKSMFFHKDFYPSFLLNTEAYHIKMKFSSCCPQTLVVQQHFSRGFKEQLPEFVAIQG